jgi:hypothetical protein
VIALCCHVHTGSAQSNRFTLRAEIEFDDKPDRAYVAVAQLGDVVSIAPAIVVENEIKKLVEVVGQVFLPGDVADCAALFFVIGKNGTVRSMVADLSLTGEVRAAALSRDALRVQLQEKSVELRQKEGQVREQKQSLKRLQEDTDAIGKVETLAAAEDTLENLKSDVARLSESLEVIQTRITALRELPPPAMARRREAELVAELKAISVALKTTEADSLKRVSHASRELTSKLELIEATKNEHIDLLQNELRSLIRERESLESGRR